MEEEGWVSRIRVRERSAIIWLWKWNGRTVQPDAVSTITVDTQCK